MKIAFFYNSFYKLGGVESFAYYFCKRYCNQHDITVYYDKKISFDYQIDRLSKFVKCEDYVGQEVDTDLIVINWYRERSYLLNFLNNAKFKESLYVIHGRPTAYRNHDLDYIFRLYNAGLITKIVSVVEEITKIDLDYCKYLKKYHVKPFYLTMEVPRVKRTKSDKIKLISATRLSPDKGGIRMRELALELAKSDIDYEWDIYTPDLNEAWIFDNIPNLNIKKGKLDIFPEIASADILIQLSDFEAYGCVIQEALSLGTRIIATNIKSLKEFKIPEKALEIFNIHNLSKNIDFIRNCKSYPDFNYDFKFNQFDRYIYEMDQRLKGNNPKIKVYIVSGELQYNINDKNYIILTDTKQENKYNHIVCDINNLNIKKIRDLIKL